MLASNLKKIGLIALAMTAVSCAFAQVSEKVVLKSHIGLSTFGSGSGNDCWGYVSPSGREYALMGLNNKVAFIEITDPSNPVIIETIPHSSSTWGDIKVYQGFAYAVTETSGTGIQVIDMTDIDNGNVTLVKTLTNPSRAHNVVLDTVNGFLYSVGTRGGTGTTMCFNLADPANPVQVGPDSMTQNYHHDGQLVNYTSGPLAGRQVWYGFSEGRGVDIYDFTDKANPVFLKRIVYPNMNYCHQGWISEDGQYLYVDDELDENGLQVDTRSLIFNVADPVNAFFVGTFSTNLPAIDHNQYVDDGFTFQANYRSGLRIFDVFANSLSPVPVGFYDTFAPNDNRGFDGAWSNYPFFPSGHVIISDINSGFFVVDVSEAVTRTHAPVGAEVALGVLVSGQPSDLATVDGNSMVFTFGSSSVGSFPMAMDAWANAFDDHPDKIKITVVSKSQSDNYAQVIDVYDWAHNQWVSLDERRFLTTGMTTTVVISSNVSDFVQPGTHQVKTRVKWRPRSGDVARLRALVDQVKFEITR